MKPIMMQLSDSDFQRMARFMQDNYGINLTKKKAAYK